MCVDNASLVLHAYFWILCRRSSYCFFDKSAKRKADLLEYCSFCDVSYTEIVNCVNTRWLSLERVAYRVLQQSAALDSFFFQKVFSGCIDDVQFLCFHAHRNLWSSLPGIFSVRFTCSFMRQ